MTLPRRLATLALFALIVVLSCPAIAQPSVTIDWTDDRLSVRAEEALLADVVGEVARRTGVRVSGAEALRDHVTMGFSALPLTEGLRRLLASVNYVMVEQMSGQGDVRPTLVLFASRSGNSGGLLVEAEVQEETPTEGEATHEEPRGERLARFLTDPDPAVRRAAVEHLANVGDQWAFSRLVIALQDESAGVREGALNALGPYGVEAISPVTVLLKSEKHPEVRVAALQILGQSGGPEAADLLRNGMSDADPRVRRAAVEGLVQTGGAVASQALRTAALDQDASVRAVALDGLGIYGDDPRRAMEEALFRGDDATQAVAVELMETLNRNGLLDASVPSATGGDTGRELVESAPETR